MSVLLTTKEAAALLSLSPRTLERLRHSGGGPRYLKIKRSVRYRLDWVQSWLDRNAVTSTSEPR
jgi:excisionase family DNA binding protein